MNSSAVNSTSASAGVKQIVIGQMAQPEPNLIEPEVTLSRGRLILNADDWGRDRNTTDMIVDAVRCKTLSSVSAMVFMEDSERASEIAREHAVDAGIHLNFTTRFSGPHPQRLQECQNSVARFLSKGSAVRAIFNPLLARSFEYLVAAQRDEFARLYGKEPSRYDGHHHVHLCSNVLMGKLLPAGATVRRYFSLESGQDLRNRAFRRFTDAFLKRYRVTDLFFSMPPLRPERLTKIFARGQQQVVEVETHPAHPEEHRFLTEGEILRFAGETPIASGYDFGCEGARSS